MHKIHSPETLQKVIAMNQTHTLINLFGQKVTVFRNDHIGDKIARNELYEKENIQFLLSLLKGISEPVVLDIGANIGNHALAFATHARQVYAFEPVPAIFRLLQTNVTQNKLDNVTASNIALSDVTETATIYKVTDGNCGASSFDRRTENVEAVTVQKIRGDDFVATNGITKLDLVKIDVEAHEIFVLRGLMETLRRHLPLIVMEWNDPLTIERSKGSPELQFLFDHYHIHVLGSNFDHLCWQGRPLAFLRRKLTRLFKPRQAVLYPFNPAKLYKNLLLVPKGRESLLEKTSAALNENH
jgi:FkbM family methyltransferase